MVWQYWFIFDASALRWPKRVAICQLHHVFSSTVSSRGAAKAWLSQMNIDMIQTETRLDIADKPVYQLASAAMQLESPQVCGLRQSAP